MRRMQSPQMTQAMAAAKPLPVSSAEQRTLREAAGMKFELTLDGKDGRLLSGRFPGKAISELVRTLEGRDYLGEIFQIAPQDLRVVITRCFESLSVDNWASPG